MSSTVVCELLNGHTSTALSFIDKGYPRPNEQMLLDRLRYPTVSFVEYLKSLGVEVKACTYVTAQVFPELLDVFKGDYRRVFICDITTDPFVDVSEDLLALAVDTRPDLYEYIRPLVIKKKYLSLFENLNVRPDEIDLCKTFEDENEHTIRYWIDKWQVPVSLFYPVFVGRTDTELIDAFMSQELMDYILKHWFKLPINLRFNLRGKVPKKYAAVHLYQTAGYNGHDLSKTAANRLAMDYANIFPQMRRYTTGGYENVPYFWGLVSEIVDEYEA